MGPTIGRRIGLSRALSKLGHCSRSQAAQLIRAGHVHLNGSIRRNPEAPVHLDLDRITVDGRALQPQEKVYVAMNKPRGVVTTASDEKGRDTVYSVLERAGMALPWVAPVGRLDKASEGLLLLTNDSEWGARIAAPETHLGKIYNVQIGTLADQKLLAALVKGAKGEDGIHLSCKAASILRAGEKNCWLKIELDEGKNRQIRRLLSALDVEVLRLIRVAIGPVELGDLAKGSSRHLSREENY